MEEAIKVGITLVATEGMKELVKTCISSYVKPKIDKFNKSTESKKNFDYFEEHIQKYMERSYNNALIMNTIVFKNQQKTINDLYIPLTVVKSDMVNKNEHEEIYIDRYREELINKYRKVLLVDSAGMGKSTIMKYLYIMSIKENKGIPILIELRKLKSDMSIIDYIITEMNGIKKYFDGEHIFELIEEGDFIFYFDGYDEIVQEVKENITERLQDFISKCPKNNFILSSRQESELSSFGDFQRFDIKELTKDEAYELIKKYDKDNEISKELIEKLKDEDSLNIVEEFLGNPLMVSLLYLAFGYRRDLPNGKHIFYEQVYNALYLDHDKSKGGAYVHPKKSNLNIDEFHKILRTLAIITLSKGVSYTRQELIGYIKESKRRNLGLEFNESNFLTDILNSVPLFIKEGNDYKWCHKSFQEYFAASFICVDAKNKQSDYLRKLSQEDKIEKYFNVLDFCYDLDEKQFKHKIVYELITEFIEYYESVYNSNKYSEYDKKQIDIRKNISFIYSEISIHVSTDRRSEEIREILKNGKCDLVEHLQNGKQIAYHLKNKRVYYLLNLLGSKKCDIAEIIERKNARNYDVFDKNGVYEINDDDDNILNVTNEIFEEVNNTVLDIARMIYRKNHKKVQFIFNIKKCLKLKEEIEDEIAIDQEEILF